MSDLTAGYVTELERLISASLQKAPEVIEVAGRKYTGRALTLLREPEIKLPAPIKIHTLTGLVGYLRDNRDGLDVARLAVHVESPEAVRLIDKLEGEHAQRRVYVETTWVTQLTGGFQFGAYHPADHAVIGLLSLFEPTPDREALVKVLGNLTGNDVKQATDDGVSQQVTVRKGVSLAADAKPDPIQRLRPYRTFRELQQPESAFLLRLKPDSEGPPKVALFEADGGRWRLEAIDEIAQYLTTALTKAAVKVAVLA